MHSGHRPEEIAAMPAWDFLLYMHALPVLQATESALFGMGND